MAQARSEHEQPPRNSLAGQRSYWSELEIALARAWKVARAHPVTVALVVFLFYGASFWLSIGLQRQNPRDWATIGTTFIARGGASSPTIQADLALAHPGPGAGYDGQFNYFIALDPLGASPYLDAPSLRYERIVYPLTASIAAFGQPSLVPYTLAIINWLAMAFGALGLGLWLRRWRITPWIALTFGLFPGLFDAFRHDLGEPLAYALVIWGILALGWNIPRGRFATAGVLFALAALTREVTLFISVPYMLRLAWPEISEAPVWRKMRPGLARAAGPLLIATGPFLVLKALLTVIYGTALPDAQQYLPFRAPFSGILTYWAQLTNPQYESQMLYVVIPGAIACVAAIAALVKSPDGWKPATITLAINALYFCVFLAPESYNFYISAGRIQSGIILMAVFALPVLDKIWLRRGWFWAANALWLAPLWFIAVYPTVQDYIAYFTHAPA